MHNVKIHTFGAGQDVGRSCFIVEINKEAIMLDCGIHILAPQKFPDLSSFDIHSKLKAVFISHFHLDHCGAVAYLVDSLKYNGPIYMTYPTRAIFPIMLEDMIKVAAQDTTKDALPMNSKSIDQCFSRIIPLNLHQTVNINGIKATTYYAGHVLGAVMLYINFRGVKILYSGDYNTTADRHLGAAKIPILKPHIFMTETTYATTVRDSKKKREREFIKTIQNTLENGGKVLIPVFALGRSQELCVLLELYWKKMGFQSDIFFSGGMTEKANVIYKQFLNWTNESIRAYSE
jgi:integrator complex subunit 11